jgi:hypothetical protein
MARKQKDKADKQDSRFAGKAAGKREKSGARTDTSEREQTRRGFLGNGLSRTAMIFRLATLAGHKLTVPELNRIKDVNPRSLERVYDQVIGGGTSGDAMFALKLILK